MNITYKFFLPVESCPELREAFTLPNQLTEMLVNEIKARHLIISTGNDSSKG
jgi:hypothetical protein